MAHRRPARRLRRVVLAAIVAVGATAACSGGGPGQAVDGESDVDPVRLRMDRLVSAFENSTTELQYGYAEDLGDGRGITAGRAGFTTATCDALEVIERYTDDVGDNPLATFVPELERLCDEGSDDTSGLPADDYAEAWSRAAAGDPAFRAAQDAVVDDEYFLPAMAIADDLGITLALLRFELYDTAIQHGVGDDPDGLPALVERTAAAVGAPSEAGEAAWLDAFLDVRLADLEDPANAATREEWAASTDRVECVRRLAAAGVVDLDGPFSFTVHGDDFAVG